MIVKHSIVIGQRKTSVSLEPEFWAQFRVMAGDAGLGPTMAKIDALRPPHIGRSSAIRLWVLARLLGQTPFAEAA